MSAKRSRAKKKPVWERGYNGHVYWLGKTKLGKVTLHDEATASHKYTWEAGRRTGVAAQLDKAKAAVELAVAMSDRQLDLFP